ncbi:MAG: hypothetical protein KJZ54_14955 [Phycisphaerales bacterium]|nr:hypothetical protein [Phycisphaerales bacterium]
MSPNQKRAAQLRVELQTWLERHDLFSDSSFDTPKNPEAIDTSQGAEPVYLVLNADGMLVDLFYKRENDDLRTEFDCIVAKHRLWYDFDDATTLHFMHDAGAEMPHG